ncbi:hypothetical protein XH89_22835 [Bradyrhizobium sp. CCBAU 53340]|nr:hypothetical protein XH89_22835 [Bradyrhizobium sp. CCBAU 53340]
MKKHGTRNQHDRRTLRTRRALNEAFLSLLVERGFDELSVLEVCERANVGRSTFYTYFQSKEDLLDGGLGDLSDELRRQAAARMHDVKMLPFARGLIDHIGEQRRLFRAIVGRRSGVVVQARFRTMVHELVAEDLARFRYTDWRGDAASHYVTGALVQVLAWWVDARSSIPADEIEAFLIEVTMNALSGTPARNPLVSSAAGGLSQTRPAARRRRQDNA